MNYYYYSHNNEWVNINDAPNISVGDRLMIDVEVDGEDDGYIEYEVMGISHEFVKNGEYLEYKVSRLDLLLRGSDDNVL